jgi:hypothetical protein
LAVIVFHWITYCDIDMLLVILSLAVIFFHWISYCDIDMLLVILYLTVFFSIGVAIVNL